MTASEPPAGTDNTISGGTQLGPVFQGRDFQVTFQAAAAVPLALAQLPQVAAGFTGRDGELGVLAGLLDPAGTAGPVVVSAVAGLAGVGKTTLAVQAGHAARARGWFGGGVLFLDLHGYDATPVAPGQALDALLRALGVPGEHIPPGVPERAGLYRSVLADISGPVLVIADNASSEAQVRLLLPGTGPHKLLVTSRHTLAGLDARLLDVTVLDATDSIALLDTALRAARPGDDRITGDPEAAGRLARICGGLPLALQITASLLKADPGQSAAELAEELAVEHMRLEQLEYDDGSGPAAPSVAAAFELSCARLEDAAARVFRLLPVHPGPDISTAAAAVLTGLPAAQARTVLAALARAHLIETAPGGQGRWRMHDLLRLYAQRISDKHADADGRDQAVDRILDYYLHTADAADDHLRALPGMAVPAAFTDRAETLAWLDAERASLIAAVQMATDNGRDQAALHLPLVLATYFNWRRLFDDWLAATIISRNTARRLGDRHSEGIALINLGLALVEVRRFEEATTACQDAATICRDTGDRHGEGMALINLGLALQKVGRFDEAIIAHQDAADICRDTGDRHGEGMALNNLGLALHGVGRFEEAITAHQDAADICQDTGDRHVEGSALDNLGLDLRAVRRFEEAITAHQGAATIHRDTGDRHREGMALDSLGVALQEVHRFEEAITAHQGAATIHRDTGDRPDEGDALNNVSAALFEAGRVEEAISAIRDAADIFRETGDRHAEGMVLNNLGLALRRARQFDEAVTAHQNAAAIFRETGDEHYERVVLRDLEASRAAREA